MSKKKLSSFLFAIIIVVLLSLYGDPRVMLSQQGAIIASTSTYQVLKAVDGDTITVLKDGQHESVRLIGIDTPETVDPRRPVECFGEAASTEMKRLVDGKSVRLEMDSSQGERDTYGRLLAYVYVDDIFVNEYLIAQGFGHEYTYIRPYIYQKEFRAAEDEARREGKGLWAPGACQ